MSYSSQRRRRFRTINARSPNAGWRNERASELQRQVLRRIEQETGSSFPDSITKGEASEIIGFHFRQNHQARKAARRASPARKRRVR